jgi:DNA mismatch endonuclease (patch repair protein)
MQGNRRRDTRPELAIRRELHRRGFRYRVAIRPIPEYARSADIVFTRAKVAVFIDGCFWHGCPDHGTTPRTHAEYWVRKLELNQRRDAETATRLRSEGWTVVRIWEHEALDAALRRIEDGLSASQAARAAS